MKPNKFRSLTFVFLISFVSCATQEVHIPKLNLNGKLAPAQFVKKLEFSEYILPNLSGSIERPNSRGELYYGILRDKETNRMVRSIAILVDTKDLGLEPEKYLQYPVYYAINMSENFGFRQPLSYEYDIRRANDLAPVYMPVYATGTVVALAAFGIVYVAFTGTAFIFGMGKGTYEFTEDIMEGIIISNEEIVLGYNDYQYDKEGKLIKISTYLPYRSISKSVIPFYDRYGKKQIGQMYPSSKPILVSEINYQYAYTKASSIFPKSAEIIEHLPKKTKQLVLLPMNEQPKIRK
ncbi:hypothetical protein JWG40_18715 [Leptospira sp. 201903074]|uniref:hypothetical protein n=1 Tax=Leptospira abararensis TaxID=2810036 RepID=UPI0019624929|nr:hypothetical protein [Leptospira abararensis]MBM9549065.1 hypothetical protein [Leptospira abararensis]